MMSSVIGGIESARLPSSSSNVVVVVDNNGIIHVILPRMCPQAFFAVHTRLDNISSIIECLAASLINVSYTGSPRTFINAQLLNVESSWESSPRRDECEYNLGYMSSIITDRKSRVAY